MSTDEIRKLAESQVLVNFCGKKHLDEEPCSKCFDHSEHICQDKEAIKSALLAYSAIVERCEKIRGVSGKGEEMREHELTSCGYASAVVAGCLLGAYSDGQGHVLLDKVMRSTELRKHVGEKRH